jgi:hypothetical protein
VVPTPAAKRTEATRQSTTPRDDTPLSPALVKFIHGYDLVSARLRVDTLNSRELGPPVSFEHVAELAVAFVDAHVVAIENIGLGYMMRAS